MGRNKSFLIAGGKENCYNYFAGQPGSLYQMSEYIGNFEPLISHPEIHSSEVSAHIQAR
jgi:hypothetical protein